MPETIKCVAKRLRGGARHEHVTEIWWEQIDSDSRVLEYGSSTIEEMVTFVRTNGPMAAWCPDRGGNSKGGWLAVRTDGACSYVQTVVDGQRTDDLLHLPDR